ncbi:MAG: PdxA family dehydrogenase [Gemmatimonadota bacterium]
MRSQRPRIGVTLGDPRGIGPEIVEACLRDAGLAETAAFTLFGPEGLVDHPGTAHRVTGAWDVDSPGPAKEAGRVAGAAIEAAVDAAMEGLVDGIVTAPVAKEALRAAGYPQPGHTELLRDRTGVEDVTMMMTAESTPVGGALRLALLTVHVPIREVPDLLTGDLVVRRSAIAVSALRGWWGLERPRLAFAGLNPHASEGGLFGDEEARILEPATRRLAREASIDVPVVLPADTVFRKCLEGEVDAVVVPYHDVGLAVLKTLALERGVNVTAGLPFPRTSPDHGTAFDIAGRGVADPGSMRAAVELCVEFCRRAAGPDGGVSRGRAAP